MTFVFDHLAVVPIFVSAGAAVLPTILATLTGIVAVMLRPRELLALIARRPVAASITTGVLGIVVTTVCLVMLRPPPAVKRTVDWAAVAEALIARELAGTPTTAPVNTKTGRDFARTNTDGTPDPTRLVQLWKYQPDDSLFLSRPIAFGDRLYVAGCQADLGGYTGILAALNLETGKPAWEVINLEGEFLLPFYSSPTITEDGKYLIIGQGLHDNRDCSLLCIETATGKLKWRVKTPLHIESSPAIHGDMVVVGAGAIEKDGRPAGDPGYVFAVRISDGQTLWRFDVADPESSPAIGDDGTVYIGSGFNGEAVVALRSETDAALKEKNLPRLLWRTPVSLPATGEITLAGDLVVVGVGNGDFVNSKPNPMGAVVALDRKTGQPRWRKPIEDSVLGSVAFKEGKLIAPSRTGEVIALAAENGNIDWRARISGRAPILAGAALGNTHVYAVSSDGFLAVLDAKSGNLLEKHGINDQAKPGSGLTGCAPQIVGGRVITGSETGGIRSFAGRAVEGGAP